MDHSVDFFFHFSLTIWQFRFVLASLFVLILLGGMIIAKIEKMRLADGIYFALQTALTLGFGDITAKTTWGRGISLVIGLLGLIFFGIIVAKATYALHLTVGAFKTF